MSFSDSHVKNSLCSRCRRKKCYVRGTVAERYMQVCVHVKMGKRERLLPVKKVAEFLGSTKEEAVDTLKKIQKLLDEEINLNSDFADRSFYEYINGKHCSDCKECVEDDIGSGFFCTRLNRWLSNQEATIPCCANDGKNCLHCKNAKWQSPFLNVNAWCRAREQLIAIGYAVSDLGCMRFADRNEK